MGVFKSFVLAMLLIAIEGGTAYCLSNSGDGGWLFYRDIAIKNLDLSDYQVLVKLSGNSFPAGSSSDGADIRFADASGNELSHWIENWDNSQQNAIIWVKIPGRQTNIRMFYGNKKASSSSNGDSTFIFFDDFVGKSINEKKWQIYGTQEMSVGNSVLYMGIDKTPGDEKGAALISRDNSNDNVIIEMKVKSNYDADAFIFARTTNYSGPIWITSGYAFSEDPDQTGWSKGAPHISVIINEKEEVVSDPTFDASPDYFYWYSAILYGNRIGFKIYDTNRNVKSDISKYDTNFNTGYLGLGKDPRDWEHSNAWIDTFIIRKYASVEPALTIGQEQTTEGSISITSSTSGAEVFIDGVSKGIASPNLIVSNIIPGSHSVKCKLSGFSDYETTITVSSGAIATVSCTLSQPGMFSVTISSEPSSVVKNQKSIIKVAIAERDGQAISDASVMLTSTSGKISPSFGTTDSRGEFISTFTATSEDNAAVSALVRKEGFSDSKKDLRIEISKSIIPINQARTPPISSPQIPSDILPSKHTIITGKIMDASTGEPVFGATVSIGGKSDSTGSDGKYEIVINTGKYESLTVTRPGYESMTKSVNVPEEGIDVDFFIMKNPDVHWYWIAIILLIIGSIAGSIYKFKKKRINSGKCIKCGAMNLEGARFCEECGEHL